MREGGVILYPTDTIWGIGCDATNEDAVRRVYEIKPVSYTHLDVYKRQVFRRE